MQALVMLDDPHAVIRLHSDGFRPPAPWSAGADVFDFGFRPASFMISVTQRDTAQETPQAR